MRSCIPKIFQIPHTDLPVPGDPPPLQRPANRRRDVKTSRRVGQLRLSNSFFKVAKNGICTFVQDLLYSSPRSVSPSVYITTTPRKRQHPIFVVAVVSSWLLRLSDVVLRSQLHNIGRLRLEAAHAIPINERILEHPPNSNHLFRRTNRERDVPK